MIQKNPKYSPTTSVKGAAAFSKSIAILQLIADCPEPPTISKLVAQTGLPRPTLHRLIKALAAEDMVEIRADKTFTVGARMIQLAGRALAQNNIVKFAEPELEWLCLQTKETVHLAVRGSKELVYIQKKDSPQSVRIAASVGGCVPLHASAIGKSMLAFLPEDERSQILEAMDLPRFTQYTITDRDTLKSELMKIRRDGYAVTHQESDLEIECYAANINDRAGRPVAGIGISVPLYRRNPDINTYVLPLRQSCSRVTERLDGMKR